MADKPGTKFILDLLAQSVAKIKACEDSNNRNRTDVKKVKTRKKEGIKGFNTKLSEDIRSIPPVKAEYVEIDFENVIKKEPEAFIVKTEVNDCQLPFVKTDIHTENHIIKTEYIKCEKITEEEKGLGVSEPKLEAKESFSDGANFVLDLLAKSAEKLSAFDDYKTTKSDVFINTKVEKKHHIVESVSSTKLEPEENSIDQISDTVSRKKRKTEPSLEELTNIKTENINIKPSEVKIGKTKGKRTVEVEGRKSHSKKQVKAKQPFTPWEDEIIRNRMEEFGDNINIEELARELGRKNGSVYGRVNRKLKIGETRHNRKLFSLAEDEAILQKALEHLGEKKLHELVLHNDRSLKDLAIALGRPHKENSLAMRWAFRLQPWLLQYFAGTLNMDIRSMLANHVFQTYPDRESIDWTTVARKPEFAGHTVQRLQNIYSMIIRDAKKTDITLNDSEISLKQTVDGFNEYMKQSKAHKVPKEVAERQQNVIDFFEQYVRKNEIYNYV